MFPTAREDFIQSILKYPTVHVNEALLLLGFRVANHRDETQISTGARSASGRHITLKSVKHSLVHLHQVDHAMIVQNDVTLCFTHLLALGLAIRVVP